MSLFYSSLLKSFSLKNKIQKFSHDLQSPKWPEIYCLSTLSVPFLASFIPVAFLAGPKEVMKAQRTCICCSLYLQSTFFPISKGHLPQFPHLFPQICLQVNVFGPGYKIPPFKSFSSTFTIFIFLNGIYHIISPCRIHTSHLHVPFSLL